MARFADPDHPHNVSPEVPRDLFNPLNLVRLCHPSSSRRRISDPAMFAFQSPDRSRDPAKTTVN
jgi:hypothetical protein